MSHRLYESEVEQIALELLRDENGYAVLYGPDITVGVNPIFIAFRGMSRDFDVSAIISWRLTNAKKRMV